MPHQVTHVLVQVRKPRWVESQDGSISLDRAGSLIVEFAPVAPGSGTNVGNRSYQWDKKQVATIEPPCATQSYYQLTGISRVHFYHMPSWYEQPAISQVDWML